MSLKSILEKTEVKNFPNFNKEIIGSIYEKQKLYPNMKSDLFYKNVLFRIK